MALNASRRTGEEPPDPEKISRGTDQRDRFPLVPPIDTEVRPIHCDNAVPRIELTHSNQAEIRQVRIPIGISFGQCRQLTELRRAVESDLNQPLRHHGKNERHALEMECRLCQHGFTSEQGLGDTLGYADRPGMVRVIPVGEGYEKAGVDDSFHGREKPLRLDRSSGPSKAPAKRRKL
jgi:hypothetical protein